MSGSRDVMTIGKQPLTDLTLSGSNQVRVIESPSLPVPAVVRNSGAEASHRFVEYFIGQIRNPNTRQAYGRAVQQFFSWCEQRGVRQLEEINYVVVASYIEQHPSSPQTILLHLASIRMMFKWLKEQGVLNNNPAENIKGPKYRVKVGKTPVLEAEDMRQLLDSFDTTHIAGLRDRAFIGLMTFTFARVSAASLMDTEDSFIRSGQPRVRLHEKGGKYVEIPLHHTASEYLHAYTEAASQQQGLNWEKGTPLFRALQRGGSNETRKLTEKRFNRRRALEMVKRRAADAGIGQDTCNHTFRGTGITNYLENGGNRDTAQELAGHEDVRTTALYDRRASRVNLGEIERMRF